MIFIDITGQLVNIEKKNFINDMDYLETLYNIYN